MDSGTPRGRRQTAWADSELVRSSPSQVEGIALDETARRILVDVGLPQSVEPLFELRAPVRVVMSDGRTACRFGSDFGTDLVVVSPNGKIVSVSPDGSYPERFVNSNLDRFRDFLDKVTVARRRISLMMDEREIDSVLDDLEASLVAADATALVDPDNWWSVVVEQMRDGLL